MKITLADIWFSFSGLQKLNSCPNPPAEKRWIFGTEIFPECEKQFQALNRLNAEIGEKYSAVIGGQRVMLTEDATVNDAGDAQITFQPAHRTGAAAASAVTVVRPTAKYVVAQPVVQMPSRGDKLPGFAVELVEE